MYKPYNNIIRNNTTFESQHICPARRTNAAHGPRALRVRVRVVMTVYDVSQRSARGGRHVGTGEGQKQNIRKRY